MIGCLPTQALAFLVVFVYATHATQAIAFEWKPGLTAYAHRSALARPIGYVLMSELLTVGLTVLRIFITVITTIIVAVTQPA